MDRISRDGVLGLSEEEGLALFDAALGLGEPVLVPIKRKRDARLERPRAETGGWASLAGLPADQRRRAVLDLVSTAAGAVLGRDPRDPVDPERGFLDLGFDSLTALELRNKLDSVTAGQLPATLIFDFPSPVALAAHLESKLVAAVGQPASELEAHLAALEAMLKSASQTERAKAAARLRTLATEHGAHGEHSEHSQLCADPDLEAMTADELLGILDRELESLD